MKKINVPFKPEPLTPQMLDKVLTMFAAHGIKIKPLDEYLNIFELILDLSDKSVFDHTGDIINASKNDSMDSIQQKADLYMQMYNSTLGILEAVEHTASFKEITPLLEPLHTKLISESGHTPSKNAKIMRDYIFLLASDIVERSGIDYKKSKNIVKDVKKAMGGDYAELLENTLSLTHLLDKKHISTAELVDCLGSIVLLTSLANAGRKRDYENDFYDEIPAYQKSAAGRNDPCPCGSGKKYKKCCLKKDENLFSVLPPAEATQPAFTAEEIHLFYETLNGFMCYGFESFSKMQHGTAQPFFISTNTHKNVANSFYADNIKKFNEYLSYLKKNLKKIIKGYLKTLEAEDERYGIITAWENAVIDDFLVLESTQQGNALFWRSSDNKIFLVHKLYDNLSTVLMPLPAMGSTMLVPFLGRITYCAIFIRTNINIGPNMMQEFVSEYTELREKEKFVTTLHLR